MIVPFDKVVLIELDPKVLTLTNLALMCDQEPEAPESPMPTTTYLLVGNEEAKQFIE